MKKKTLFPLNESVCLIIKTLQRLRDWLQSCRRTNAVEKGKCSVHNFVHADFKK